MTNSLIYFMENETSSKMRIGFTGREDPEKRLADHRRYGYRELALVPGYQSDEQRLHDHFDEWRESMGGDRSHYKHAAVKPYVDRLLDASFASPSVGEAIQADRLPWSIWSPAALDKPIMSRNQICMFPTDASSAEARDTWQTPMNIAALAREALGGVIDLDPCSCLEANKRVEAIYFYSEKSNGLIRNWEGNIYLNPPYESAGGAEEWIEKLIDEIEVGNTKQAITVLNLQSVPTLWFPRVRSVASSHAIFARRIQFHGPLSRSGNSPAYGASKNGTIFSYFGKEIDRFASVFRPHAMVVREI